MNMKGVLDASVWVVIVIAQGQHASDAVIGLYILGLITAALFFIAPFYNVVYVSYRLALTPDALQSRVNSVARLIGLGFAPLGVAFTGILLQYFGPQITLLLSAGGQVLLVTIAIANKAIRATQPKLIQSEGRSNGNIE